MRTKIFLAVAIAAAWLGAVMPAVADDGNRARAQTLFEQARTQMSQGDFTSACDRLAESQRLDPALGTLLNLAVCNEQRGRTATAWRQYTEVAARARVAGDADRERIAIQGVEGLSPALSRVKFASQQPPLPGAWLRIDGLLIDTALLDQGVPLDPGLHQLAWGAPGKRSFTQAIDVQATEGAKTVALPDLADEAAQTRLRTTKRESAPSSFRWPLVAAASGVAVAGAAVTIVLGLRARDEWRSRNQICEDRCTLAAKQAGDRANTYAWVANGTGALTLVAAALGTFWALSSGSHSAEPRIAVAAAPLPGGAIAQGNVAF